MEKDARGQTGLKIKWAEAEKLSGEMGAPLHLPSPSVPTVQSAIE